jgi:hypothetical protein
MITRKDNKPITVQDLIIILKDMIKEDPKLSSKPIILSSDEEGNDFHPLYGIEGQKSEVTLWPSHTSHNMICSLSESSFKSYIREGVRQSYEADGMAAACDVFNTLSESKTYEYCPSCECEVPSMDRQCLICGQATARTTRTKKMKGAK